MVEANGNKFITLDDEMTVNGEKVYEVWANGQQVYPEVKTGNFVKFRGETHVFWAHAYPKGDWIWCGNTNVGPLYYQEQAHVEWYSIDASFVEIIKAASGGLRLDNYFSYQGDIPPADARNKYINPRVFNEPLGYAQGQQTLDLWFTPGMQYQSLKRIDSKYKFRVSPLPAISEYHGHYRSIYQYYWKRKTNGFTLPMSLNGEILDAMEPNGDIKKYVLNRGSEACTIWGGPAKNYIPENSYSADNAFDSKLYYMRRIPRKTNTFSLCCGYPIQCSIDRFEQLQQNLEIDYQSLMGWPIGAKVNGWGEWQKRIGNVSLAPLTLAVIPITECMYLGSEEEAPDWAFEIYDEDFLT